MEQLIKEVAGYAAAIGIKPATVLQKAGGLGGNVWGKWVAGTSSCTLPMADRLRAYMAANPPVAAPDAPVVGGAGHLPPPDDVPAIREVFQ